MDGHVGGQIGATSLPKGANDTFIVTSDENVGVRDTEGNRDANHEFNSNGLEPSNVMSNGYTPPFQGGPHVPETIPEDTNSRTSGSIHPNIIVTGGRMGSKGTGGVMGEKGVDPPLKIGSDCGAHVAWNEFGREVRDPAVEVGEIRTSMEEDKGTMDMEEGLDMHEIFDTFGFWEGDGTVGEVKGVTDIVLDIAEFSAFEDAIRDAQEGAIRVRNMNDEEVVNPFPGGTDVCVLPDVLSGIGNFTLKTSCRGSTKRKVAFVIWEDWDCAICSLNIEGCSLGAWRSGSNLKESPMSKSTWRGRRGKL
ncbi:hypothetical protein EDB19DRAFT_1833175 [Suillus lakei]|nr:hypothetical protein EDB19DRAFT_1833175 [Suillus lakei]